MLNLKIYDEKEEKTKKPLYFRLEQNGSTESIDLVVTDKNGDQRPRGSILSITTGGKLKLHRCISPTFGLELDTSGKIKLY